MGFWDVLAGDLGGVLAGDLGDFLARDDIGCGYGYIAAIPDMDAGISFRGYLLPR